MTDAPRDHEPATLSEDDLVTGEAVALDLPAAGLGSRVASGALDLLVTGVALLAAVGLLRVASIGADGALQTVASLAAVISVLVVLPTTLETLTRGRSVGKLALGLRTVRDDAGPISAQHAFVRAMVGVVEIYALTGVPALLCTMANRRGKRLGDLAAGTYVVRDRFRLALPPPVPMPEHLEAWARQADLAPLPTGLALAVRRYLLRLPGLDPASRERVGAALVAQVEPFVAPAPPPGTAAHDYLAAVAALRRRRDQDRLARERDLRERLTGHP